MECKDDVEILIEKCTDENDSELFYGIIPPLACMHYERNTITLFSTILGFGGENQLGKVTNTDIYC
jgi:hypothetical protein